MKRILQAVLLVIAALAIFVFIDSRGRPEQPGEITAKTLPAERLAARAAALQAAGAKDKQILFGDFHVHTTYSVDAHAWSMPIFHGEGVHPPAEACDYARFCADLDFWATTEHAESLTPRHWRDLKNVIRQCNAVSGDPANPDLVSFLGWEWTQMGNTPADHYGHKNVILRDTEDAEVPSRPIGSGGIAARAMRNSALPFWRNLISPYLDWDSRQTQWDQQLKMKDLKSQPICAEGVPVRELPEDCVEFAETPKDLFAKLNDWGFESLVIPHGNTWGFYTPPGSSWDKQLTRAQHDPNRQTLIEVFSGHGNSEEFRDWREVAYDAEGNMTCPAPSRDYLPSCWRAGEIIRSRCGALPAEDCERRVKKAQLDYLAAGRAGHLVVPGVTPEDWLDSGQCRDCYLPAFNYRPRSSVQYALALSNFDEQDEQGNPLRFRFGFIASSDNHAAQPGTGYKETGRHANTEVYGQEGTIKREFIDKAKPQGKAAESVPFDLSTSRFNFMQIAESERVQSYFYTGGLVAVHSAGRDRQAIWDALKRREVYGTSGERMLLWFDLVTPDGRRAPMGSEVALRGTPRFRVRAVGDFEQLPGCPDYSVSALTPEKVERICRGECYNPSDTRKPIERIEVVRILPQAHKGEAVEDLIEDPWKVIACSGDPNGCSVEFADTTPAPAIREAIYYVRAIQKASPTVNADNLRCEYNDQGECINVKPCYGDLRTDKGDDCMAPAEERAWSSPIYVRPM
ncbi:MAG TPA: DUF3604 domain-containing protein [Nevskiales bacterium]|nr:DUF3604 domain-containing protein [Nevskiales bacterium]